jgi:hypothetical protein
MRVTRRIHNTIHAFSRVPTAPATQLSVRHWLHHSFERRAGSFHFACPLVLRRERRAFGRPANL